MGALLVLSPTPTHAAMVINRTTELTSLDKDDSLVGWWTMDGKDIYSNTVLDKNLGTKNNGVKTGTQVVTGKIGQALKFNGSSDKIDTVSNAQQFTDISVSFWAKPNASQQSSAVIIGQQEVGWSGNGTDGGWMIMQNAGNTNQYLFEWLTANQAGTTNGLTFSIDANKWSHVTVTKSGATVTHYVNGVNVGSADGSSAALYYAVDKKINIGYWYWDNTRWWGGSLDDVRIYSRSLSASEAKNLYYQGAKKQAVTVNTSFAQATSTLNWGLINYLTFDGKDCGATYCLDKNPNSGTRYNGTIAGGVTKIPGKFGQALKFDGVNGYINAGTPILPAIADFSVSVWFKTSAGGVGPGGSYPIVAQYNADVGRIYALEFGRTAKRIGVFVQGAAVTGTRDFTLDAWHLATVTRSGGNYILYLDGVLDNSGALESTIATNVNTSLGAELPGYNEIYSPVTLDDARIYNRVLSATEIKNLYNLGGNKQSVTVNKTPAKTTLENDANLVGWWTMDGKDIYGTTVLDKSATKNNGTRTGAVSAPGKIGQGLLYDGSDDLVSLATPPTLGSSDYTVSAWIKTSSSADQSIWNVNMATTDYEWSMETGPTARCATLGVICFVTSGSSPSYLNVTGTKDIHNGQWHQAVIVKSGSSGYIYVDGLLDAGPTTIHNVGGTPNYGTIGKQVYGDSRWTFNGSIDDVRLYSRALSAAEVAQLYKYGR